jgi:hypothetical protein
MPTATQYQMQRNADQKVLDRCKAFSELVSHPTNPLTRSDLTALIARHPERYSMFAGWLPKLPA